MPFDRRVSRSVVLLLALLSAVVLGVDQEAACEMHGGVGAVGVVSGGRHHHADASFAKASHESHSRNNRDSNPRDSHDCCCTCIGDCSATAPVATIPATTTVRVATIAAQPRRAAEPPTSDAPPASAERRLPFPNGPPATRLS